MTTEDTRDPATREHDTRRSELSAANSRLIGLQSAAVRKDAQWGRGHRIPTATWAALAENAEVVYRQAMWLAGTPLCEQCGVRRDRHPAGDGLTECPGDFGPATPVECPRCGDGSACGAMVSQPDCPLGRGGSLLV